MQPPVVQEATGSNGTRLNSLTNVSCAPCKGSCDCIHTGEIQEGKLKTWIAGLKPEPSPAMSKLYFIFSSFLSPWKMQNCGWQQAVHQPCAAVSRNRVCKAKPAGQISHKLIFTVISLVCLYHSWLQFPSSVHLGILSCAGISVLSAGSAGLIQGHWKITPSKTQIKEFLCKGTNCPIKPLFL